MPNNEQHIVAVNKSPNMMMECNGTNGADILRDRGWNESNKMTSKQYVMRCS
ncbi:hypothetical protein [Paenibacillus sp. 481]|uniref:hypothetical protein n=1 Tax=Paenibacillus sp. 481 TaxID=2835869 RepID=UPI001E294A79|nr:hypothetical protein [Paenibacillus sp. 481]UHA74582.1 hypothetical protein KIK04_05680 [Paenibacillus sp. 481]